LQRVLGVGYTRVQHHVVAGALTFGAQVTLHHPHERMPPVHRRREFGCHMDEPVTTADVRQFVSDDDTKTVEGPLL
jgi:hypothetical protein